MICIREVKTQHDLKAFVRFPVELYGNHPNFVPSPEEEDLQTLKAHPAKSFCSLKMWLAYKDNQLAGRIAGIVNHQSNRLKDQKRIRFGWFDVIDDYNVAKALFITVEQWGIEMGMKHICGPSRFSNMEKQGMLVWGFDNGIQSIFTDYNAPYYADFVERLSFVKEVDYLQYKIMVNDVPERIRMLSEKIMQRYEIKIKEFVNEKEMLACFRQFFHALNLSYQDVYNFIPLTEKEITCLIKYHFRLIRKEFVCMIVDKDNQIAGFSLSIPSLSETFQKIRGKLFPLGWYQLRKECKHPQSECVHLVLTGVTPQWQSKGIHALYHVHLNRIYAKYGFRYAVSNPQLEDNSAVRIWQKYESELLFRRRCYVKSLTNHEEQY
jgi:hypothetical protein